MVLEDAEDLAVGLHGREPRHVVVVFEVDDQGQLLVLILIPGIKNMKS